MKRPGISQAQEIRERNTRVSELTAGGKSMTEIAEILGITKNQVAYSRKCLGLTEPLEAWSARNRRENREASEMIVNLFDRD